MVQYERIGDAHARGLTAVCACHRTPRCRQDSENAPNLPLYDRLAQLNSRRLGPAVGDQKKQPRLRCRPHREMAIGVWIYCSASIWRRAGWSVPRCWHRSGTIRSSRTLWNPDMQQHGDVLLAAGTTCRFPQPTPPCDALLDIAVKQRATSRCSCHCLQLASPLATRRRSTSASAIPATPRSPMRR